MDFRLDDTTTSLELGTTLERFNRNMEAIQIAKSQDAPTPEQLKILSKYVGWGDSQLINEYKNRDHPVKETLTDQERAEIEASFINAHYTDVPVIRAMWGLLEVIGFGKSSSLKILDPSAGNGLFKSAAPDWAFRSKWLEVEKDIVSGMILKKLHPASDVRIKPFQDIDLPKEIEFDLAITNVPFGDVNIHHKDISGSIHNFFLLRMASLLREVGVLAAITSRFSMDSSSDYHRYQLRNQGMRLLGGFRMPNTAFKKNARTEVVTDVLFFIKDRNRVLPIQEESWCDTQFIRDLGKGGGYYLNEYFYRNKKNVLGSASSVGTMYGKNEYTVIPPEGDFNLSERLFQIGIEVLPRDIYKDIEEPVETENPEVSLKKAREIETVGLFGPLPINSDKLKRVEALTKIYKLAKELIAADYENASADNKELRVELNKVYDDYVALNGYINQQRSLELIKGTPAGMFLQALELVIAVKGEETQFRKATIFSKRTVNSVMAIKENPSIKDAFAFVVGTTGEISLPKIEKLTGKSLGEIIEDLRGDMFYDPKEKKWVTRTAYLSGNIRQKLEYARNISGMARYDISQNIRELEAVLPEWKHYTDYVTTMQARWIPNEIIRDFISELLNIGRFNVEVEYLESVDERKIIWPKYINYVDLCTTYGTYDMDAREIITRILNTRPIIVYAKDKDGNTYKDEQATMASQEKARVIKERFDKWIYADPLRVQVCEQVFNEKYNSNVTPKISGAHMVFDGLNTNIELHPYQKDGAARIVYSKNTLLSYDVGWGKTFTFLAGIMKSISCGLAKKAMLVVPNHLVEQTVKQVMWAYPMANVMFPGEGDKKKTTRPIFMSRIATGNYDIIVVPFSFFKLMPIADEIIRATIQEKIDQLEEIITEKFGKKDKWSMDKMDTATKKRLEKAKMRLEDKLKKMSEMRKDSAETITFDKLGVDMLVTDEFHWYKNVELITRMQSVAGLQTQGNQTTFDMLSKIQWMQKQGYKVVGSTATPVTNTIGEAFSLMKYFCPDELDEAGLSTFDAWADMFAIVESAPEMTPDGSGFRMNNRFRKFINVEQLSQMIGHFAEMRRGDNEATFARPNIYGGRMTKIVLPSTEELRNFVKELASRADRIRSGGVKPNEDNLLLITSDGRKAALDISLVKPKKNLSLADMPKIGALVNNVYNIWLESAPTRSTQLVFCDIGIWKPAKESEEEAKDEVEEILTSAEAKVTKDVYSIIKNCLIAKGVPVEEIAFAHEAVTPEARRKREDDMNSGRVRVLIGSTQKMGTGMNVQTRLIAIHHLDAPWRPADIEQRNGRGWRQGNYHKQIAIFVYVIEGSFDGYIWQTLETKVSFIDQLMHGHLHAKEMEDISETVLSFAEIKAAASGNHKIIEFTILSNELKKLKALQAAYQKEKLIAEAKAKTKIVTIPDVERHMERVKAAIACRDKTPADPFEIEIDRRGEYVRILDKADAGRSLKASIADHIGAVLNGRVSYGLLGFYRGLEIRMHSSVNNKGGTRFTLGHLEMDYDFNVSESEEGTIQSIINTSRAFEKLVRQDEEKIEQLKQEDAKTAEELARPWDKQARFDEVRKRYEELSAELRSSGENPLDELEKRRETEKAMVAESEKILDEISEYIIECHKLPSYLSMFAVLDGSGIIDKIAHNEQEVLVDVIGTKLKDIQQAAVAMEEEFVRVFQQVIVKKKNKKTGNTLEAVQFAFF